MSLDTWKAEFYPIPAGKVPVEDAVQHSLRKWRGLTKENLEKHGVARKGRCIVDEFGRSELDSTSCALCIHHYSFYDRCFNCPIVVATGDTCGSDYANFLIDGNPLPMIEALEKAAELGPAIK
jgi:hypothetical protein